MQLIAAGKHDQALAALLKLSESTADDARKSGLFHQAALCAGRLKQFDRAMELAGRIPLAPTSKAARMQVLSLNGRWRKLLDAFQHEGHWPLAAGLPGRSTLRARLGLLPGEGRPQGRSGPETGNRNPDAGSRPGAGLGNPGRDLSHAPARPDPSPGDLSQDSGACGKNRSLELVLFHGDDSRG